MVEFDQLIKECRQYNKLAQKMLYDMYAPKMKGLCYRYVGNSETAKDLVQEGFIKVFSNIKQFDRKGSFDGWIKRIFINTTISHIRKQEKKNKHVNLDDADESNYGEIDNQYPGNEVDVNMGNLEILSSDLSEEELLDALNRIPEKFRTVFNLFCIEHLKHEEIALILGIDAATSRTRLLRARNMIQKELYSFCLEKLKQ